MQIAKAVFGFVFGSCRHSNLSRVFTLRGRSYRVCCDCGAEFNYSLETMSIEQQPFPRLLNDMDPKTGKLTATSYAEQSEKQMTW